MNKKAYKSLYIYIDQIILNIFCKKVSNKV